MTITRSELIERLECQWYGTPPPTTPTHDVHEELVRLVLLVDSVARGMGDD